jgi:UDP-N-acetylmuramate--alanine ligase
MPFDVVPLSPVVPLSLSTPAAHRTKAHLIGICGSGMRALAELLLDLGWSVTGSDLSPSESARHALEQRGLIVPVGHRAAYLPPDANLVVYSPAVPEANAERVAATRRGIPQYSYTPMLGRLMQGREGVGVAGTHGKSTTTALLGTILTQAGRSPSVVCGAELIATQTSGWAGAGDLFVVESCEYQRHFLALKPRHAIILDIEPDHFDCFRDLDAAVEAYREFAAGLPADGLLLCRAGRDAVARAARDCRARVRTFAVKASADWSARNVRMHRQRVSFRIHRSGVPWGDDELHVSGRHNVGNALAAAAMASELGADPEAIREAICTFRGLRRRCEYFGAWRGIDLIDDYAHHPTAVSAALTMARAQFGRRRIWCAFQPHQVSRTRALLAEFADSFQAADCVLIAPVYAAREAESEAALATSQELARRTEEGGTPARCVASLDHVVSTLETEARPGDVLVLMGAGDIERIRHEFTRRIQRYHAS